MTAAPPRRRLSARRLLPIALALLVAGAVLPVLALGWITVRDGSQRYLRDRAELVMGSVAARLTAQLDPAPALAEAAAAAMAAGRLDDDAARQAFAEGALGALPQVVGLALIAPDGAMTRWTREGSVRDPPPTASPTGAPPAAGWLEPFVSQAFPGPILAYRRPLTDARGTPQGILLVAVAIGDLSSYLAEMGAELALTPFVLRGREEVLAHPALGARRARPALPRLGELGDPVLAAIWRDPQPLDAMAPLRGAEGHWSWVEGLGAHVFFFRPLGGYAPEPLLVGFHLSTDESRRTRWANWLVLALGLPLLAGAIWGAARLGRAIARPVGTLAGAAAEIEASHFDAATRALDPVRNGRVAETAAAAEALGRAADALRLFETYVPRALVRRLRRSGDDAAAPREAELTLLFLDLEGYSAFAAGRPAPEVAAYVNEVLAVAGPRIEAAGGTIDKFTGDGLLAFWGAPTPRADHAEAALALALELVPALAAHHDARVAAGRPACRVRLGLHAGRVVVGDIGFPGRVNYTVLGGAVNLAARVQAALRGVAAEEPVVLAASESTLAAAGLDVAATEALPAAPPLPPLRRILTPRR